MTIDEFLEIKPKRNAPNKEIIKNNQKYLKGCYWHFPFHVRTANFDDDFLFNHRIYADSIKLLIELISKHIIQ